MAQSIIQISIENQAREYLLRANRIDPIQMPDLTDVEACWQTVADAYLPDGVPEFQNYPLASLGWMMYVGMAVTKLWDTDWERYSKEPNLYAMLRDKRGYDCMDEAIADEVLRVGKPEQDAVAKLVVHCAQTAYDVISHAGIEPSTPEAFVAYVDALHALYRIGAATELYSLGYRMQKL